MIAKRYASYDSERVFFEIMNEPEMHDAYRWYGVETKLAAAIRQSAPTNTILAAGAKWDDDDDMVFLEPLRDPNVIYVFHFYEPHIFTHQGATWGAYYWHWLKDLHYPSDPKNAEAVAATVPEAVHRLAVIRYGQDHWDASRIEADINQASEWAKQNRRTDRVQRIRRVSTSPAARPQFAGSRMYARRSNGTTSAGPCGITRAASASQ